MGLDPAKYFIIVPNMFGTGLSSSPSNTPEPFDGPRFPHITFYDNVIAQYRLVTEHLGIEHLRLVLAGRWAQARPTSEASAIRR